MKRVCVVIAAGVLMNTVLAAQEIPLRNWPVPKQRTITSTAALSSSASFLPVTPCRVYDSRINRGGPGPVPSGETRTVDIVSSPCAIPATAAAYSLNVIVTGSPAGDAYQFLVAFPSGSTRPTAATVNFRAGAQVGNAAIVPAGNGGSIDVYSSLQTEVIIDINGYFTAAGGSNSFPTSGSVGIGTPSPSATLHVVGDLRIGTNGTNTDIRIYADAPQALSGTSYSQVTAITPVTVPGSGKTKSVVHFKSATAPGQGTNEVDVVVDGNIAAKYQDLAEVVPAEEQLAAGTVVVLDTKKLTYVRPSSRAYDSAVAGVVSLQPGITLGTARDGNVKVATTGRVKVRVTAANGPIAVGDLLVTSDRQGTAMKSLPVSFDGVSMHRPGTIIGKAIEPLDRGEGEILILLSLQ